MTAVEMRKELKKKGQAILSSSRPKVIFACVLVLCLSTLTSLQYLPKLPEAEILPRMWYGVPFMIVVWAYPMPPTRSDVLASDEVLFCVPISRLARIHPSASICVNSQSILPIMVLC